jgi:hypothetical protein
MTASVDGTVRLWDIEQVMHRSTGLLFTRLNTKLT